MKGLVSSLFWLFLTVLFGLLQLWILLGYDQANSEFSLDLDKLLLDGVLLFFCCALVSSITIDYHFDKTIELPKWASGILFSFFPFVIVGLSIWLFTASYIIPKDKIELEFIGSVNYIILTMTCLYTVATKSLTFNKG
ncbi:hypothetical protein [Marinobacterium weihaiense]|uniref:Uncharacterized protein n=1 Tax=Marinobacterium weihaiense TaxID=2851016 RepID=A0ABS6MFC2_9GAMM|nr:hypothetical protein [Marinobacterium weihaiense]MBV0934930.1 hypothetical protein [Marinobacterium weihaiense]